jgi:hypothetical protein
MKYSILQAPFFAFFSREFYANVARQGRGSGFLYLFLLLVICYPLSLLSGYLHFVAGLESKDVSELVEKLPDLSVRQGVLTINKASPYRMVFKNVTTGENTIIVFDTSGKTDSPGDAKALVTGKGIMFNTENKIVPWSSIASDFDFPASKFKESLKSVALGVGLAGLLLLPLVWCGHVLLALIYGVVGLCADRNKLGYVTALRMAVVAMTPAIVLTTLFYVLFGTPEMFFFLLVWELATIPITMGYLIFGYSALGNPSSG